ncbi:hypothetical protein GCM10022381_21360 [Leifsonia kafniensis]|uniref:2-oxoglutarate dehydrogenase n=1 Tax=Leifsonia kafniensis TaxID=475957 RepID=A0ABP7KLI9_9MICO
MVAESIPERRPVLPTSSVTRFVRTRTAFAVVLVGIVTAASAVLIPSSAQAAAPSSAALSSAGQTTAHRAQAATSVKTETADDSVNVQLSPTASVVLHPGEDLRVTATVSNHTADTIPVSTINVYLAERALTSRTAIDDWLHPESTTGTPGDLLLSHPLTAELQPGHSTSVDLTIPAANVGLTTGNAWGARGIAATVTTDADAIADGRSTIIWYSGEPITPITLATVFPLTVPADSADASGLISADTLASLTGPSGQLSRELAAVENRPITLAIDPMILASIRILGNSAPADAVDWLDRLTQATNDSFPLSYADADIALQAQAGAPALLEPLSFEQDIDPSLFTTPPATGDESTTPLTPPSTVEPSSASPTPTPSSGAVIPPTTAELLDFDYTMTDVGWPSAGVVSSADLEVFAASGLGSTILSGANVTNSDQSVVPNSVLDLEHTVGLTTDDALQSALRSAASAVSFDAWRGAMAEASALLAVVAAEQPTAARTLLTTFNRATTEPMPFLSQTLEALESAPWQKPGTLQAARSAAPTAGVAFASQSEPDSRVDNSAVLLTREAELTAFSTALTSPLEVTGTQRLEVLTLLSVDWETQPEAWLSAVNASLASSLKILDSVVVTTKGPINVVGSKVDIPVTLTNALDQAVTVRVNVVPSNGRLVVGSDEETTIEANSARAVKVPVSAAVGNGEVTLRVTLFSPTGAPIGEPGMIAINVRADWESLGTAIFALLVVLFFGFGVWRNIARRRKARTAPAAETDGTATDGVATDSDATEDAAGAGDTGEVEPPKTVTEPGDDTRE